MKKIRLLLAEDHAVVREGIRDLIAKQSDMEVVGEAANGEESVKLVSQLSPDIVLMDIAMPKLNGIEATRQIKSNHPSVCILILTAYDNDEFVFALLDAGAAGYLLKNMGGSELLNAIRATYSGESVLHPAIASKVFKHLFEQLKTKKKPSEGMVEALSQREQEVLGLGARGFSNKEIAAELCVGERTIETHWRNIFNKLGVSSRTEALMTSLRCGWLNLQAPESRLANEDITR